MCEGRAGIFVFHTAAETLVLQSAVAASSSTCSQKYQVRAPRTRLSSGDHVEHRSLQHSILVCHTLLHSLSHVRQASTTIFQTQAVEVHLYLFTFQRKCPPTKPKSVAQDDQLKGNNYPNSQVDKGSQLSIIYLPDKLTFLHDTALRQHRPIAPLEVPVYHRYCRYKLLVKFLCGVMAS